MTAQPGSDPAAPHGPRSPRGKRLRELLVLLFFVLLTAALISLAAGDAWERFFPTADDTAP